MKRIRRWIRDVFGFSGTEINGFLILIPLMLILVLSEPLYHRWMAGRARQADTKQFDSLAALWDTAGQREPAAQAVALFQFDPNTVEVDELVSLGVGEVLANRIAAYRRKGGVFRVKSDLLKIYGLDSALYHQLYDSIKLPVRPGWHNGKRTSRLELSNRQHAKKFDINIADTLQLKSVYGIGSRLAARIVKFRESLGGFVKRDQLFEVYGLDSVTVTRLLEICFIAADFVPEKININTASERRLSEHPYISNHLARLLVRYRFQHGDFRDVSDIKKLSEVRIEDADRILPYLKVKD